jgi:hypothetical protein
MRSGISPALVLACLGAALAAVGGHAGAEPMGNRSRATIAITASVMPQFKLIDAGRCAGGGEPALMSNAPGLRIHVVDEPVGSGVQVPERSRKATAIAGKATRLLLIVAD